jgi:hypothetical protein
MPASSEAQVKAAREFLEKSLSILKERPGATAALAVSATARMAGTFLFRSFNFPANNIQPGTAVLSDLANEKGPKLINVAAATLMQLGIPVNSFRTKKEDMEPLAPFLETQRLLEPSYLAIKKRQGLDWSEAAVSAAFATAHLIKRGERFLNAEKGFAIAVYGFIEGSKTAPDPFTLAERE